MEDKELQNRLSTLEQSICEGEKMIFQIIASKEEGKKNWTGYVSWVKAGSNGKDTIEKASAEGSSFKEIVEFVDGFGEDMILEIHIQRR